MKKYEREALQAFLNEEKRVLAELEDNYAIALHDINLRLENLLARNDADLPHVIYQIEYQKALKTQVQAILEQLQVNEFETISDYLTRCYNTGFIGSMYSFHKQGLPFLIPIDQKQVVDAIRHKTKLKKKLYDELGVDIKKLQKTIAGEISRGISTGLGFGDIARNISMQGRIPLNRAMTIARTESHRIQCQATSDAQYKAKEKGADVLKQWDAALDGATRPHHRQLDGQIRELDEPFEVAGMKAMFPGDFGKASEDCNCRCAILQRARWALDESELNELKERAAYYGLDKTKDFEDFQKKYLKASEQVRDSGQKKNEEDTSQKQASEKAETLENTGENGIIKLPNTTNCHYATPEQYEAEKKKCKKNVSKADVTQIAKHVKADGSNGGYVATHNYININSWLRDDGFSKKQLDDDDLKTLEAMRRAIQSNTLDDDYVLTRYVNADYISSVFGIMEDGRKLANYELSSGYKRGRLLDSVVESIKNMEDKQIPPDKAFLSTSMLKDKNIMKDKAVRITINAPKGTHAYIPENKKESECILGENTRLYITNVTRSIDDKIEIFCTIVG